ncbi:DUF29 domain-containing protein [Nostoc paludosum FACHB-159]|uniref:DUF29 domain-containing protein n=1 Tax=Nostoc paludosum FACHB-159 TaxID=2692908 RepID=A0ABR8K939_9NOSO|nr:DUF29 domain-containing protein [Nostoc sp. FACHB-857]MBD2735234.1 DUF29 domain-containing protein [Nostoc paludosum FACHB-159]
MPKTAAQLYETDFVAWTKHTVQLIRDRQFDQIDWDAVIEEIESLGRSERRELKSRLEVLLQHLLKWQYQSNLQSGSWQNTIDEQRNRIIDLLQESPSLKSYPEEVLAQCYHRGLKAASNETKLAIDTFPTECPYSIAQILDAEFLPNAINF